MPTFLQPTCVLPHEQRRNSIITVKIAKCAAREKAVEARTVRAGSRGGRVAGPEAREQNPEFWRPDPRDCEDSVCLCSGESIVLSGRG